MMVTDRASIDRVMRSFTCVEGRDLPRRDAIAVLADVNAIFAELEVLQPLAWEVWLGVATRSCLDSAARLYVARNGGEIDAAPGEPLHTLWQLDDGLAERLLELYARRLSEEAARVDGTQPRAFAEMASWATAAARAARGLGVYCFVST